ncbi:hypothetical protein MMC29_008508 [Sticta canariensis]|nr:hypothetical protein [Sticta canariensis]
MVTAHEQKKMWTIPRDHYTCHRLSTPLRPKYKTLKQPDASMSTQQFASAITSQLLDVVDSRFGYIHKHTLETQDDQWTDLYHARIGIPVSHYAERLELLRVIPPGTLHDPRLDRSSTEEEIQRWETANPGAGLADIAASNYGGSMRAVKAVIRKQAMAYMYSFPGRDGVAFQTRDTTRKSNKCIDQPHSMNDRTWEYVWEILRHRFWALPLAETFVHGLGLGASKACQWDMDAWLLKHNKTDLGDMASRYFGAVMMADLIPKMPNSRAFYGKAAWYLAVACAESDLPEAEILDRLKVAFCCTNVAR